MEPTRSLPGGARNVEPSRGQKRWSMSYVLPHCGQVFWGAVVDNGRRGEGRRAYAGLPGGSPAQERVKDDSGGQRGREGGGPGAVLWRAAAGVVRKRRDGSVS